MKTKHSITWLHRLALALALSFAPAFVFGQGAPNIPKELPKELKVPKTPNVPKEAPKIPDVPKTIKVPNTPKVVEQPKVPKEAPKVPKIVEAPKAPNAPKNIPKVVEAPKVPKTPAVPQAPPVVKVPDAPKVPKTPVVVKVPDAPKVPKGTPKVPVVAKVPDAPKDTPKVPVVVDVPKVKKPTVIRAINTPKPSPSPIAGNDKERSKGSDVASASSSSEKRATIQGGNGETSGTKSSKKKEKDYTDIAEAYRRLQQSEDAKDDASDPYNKGGAFDRDQFRKDERLVADFENEQIGAKDLLEGSKKPGGAPEENDDDTPVAVTRGRIKDLSKVEGVGQIVGLKGDEKELVDAKDEIARGKVKDPKAVDRLVDGVANKGVDQQYGEAPEVSVKDLTNKGDELKKQGKFREARDYYDQAIDALKNGGKNSAAYRLNVIAEIDLGTRPAKDLSRVVKPGVIGKAAGTPPVDAPVGAGVATTPATAPQDNAAAAEPVGQRIAGGIVSRAGKEATKAVGGGALAGTAAGGTGGATTDAATAGSATDVGAGAGAATSQDGAAAGVSNQLGADTQNLGANAPASTATTAPGTDGAQPGNNEAPMSANPEASVTTPADEVVLSSPGNNQDFVHQQSADGNTSADISYHTDGTFTAVVTTVTRDADGQVTATTSQTVNGTYSEGDDGERHHTATSATSPTSTDNSQSSDDGSSGDGSSNDGDDDDDKKDGETAETPATTTEAEPAETAEANDDTAEASKEGTPNPEAAERGSHGGRLAEMTGGRLGGDEQRRQNKGLEQRKNGNGAGGPNPERNASSGVLLTAEEQRAFAKHLNMKRGGGVTTPNENASSSAITERDLKDIAARRGSLINPAGNGDKGVSGMSFGKKGFTPGAGGAPAPAPQGVQTSGALQNSAIHGAPAAASAVRSAGVEVNVDTVKIQQGVK